MTFSKSEHKSEIFSPFDKSKLDQALTCVACFKNTDTCCSISVFQRVILFSRSAQDISDDGGGFATVAVEVTPAKIEGAAARDEFVVVVTAAAGGAVTPNEIGFGTVMGATVVGADVVAGVISNADLAGAGAAGVVLANAPMLNPPNAGAAVDGAVVTTGACPKPVNPPTDGVLFAKVPAPNSEPDEVVVAGAAAGVATALAPNESCGVADVDGSTAGVAPNEVVEGTAAFDKLNSGFDACVVIFGVDPPPNENEPADGGAAKLLPA